MPGRVSQSGLSCEEVRDRDNGFIRVAHTSHTSHRDALSKRSGTPLLLPQTLVTETKKTALGGCDHLLWHMIILFCNKILDLMESV